MLCQYLDIRKVIKMIKRQKIRHGVIIISFTLFPIVIFFFSPYIVILGAMIGVIAGSVIMFSIQFLLSLFLGRALCGYGCPVGGLEECLIYANDKKIASRKYDYIKYCLWIPWLIAILVLFIRAGGIKNMDFFFHTINGVSLNEPFTYSIYYGVVFLIVILSLILGKRAFCHCVCWMAPFMVIGTNIASWLKIPRLHLNSDKAKCINCKKCSEKCPMSLDVMYMVENEKMANSECILCGECIDSCPKKVISYTFKNK